MIEISPCYMEVGARGVLLATLLMSESLLLGKNSSYCCCNEYATEAMYDFQHARL